MAAATPESETCSLAPDEESPMDCPFTDLLHETVTNVCATMTLESANRKMDWRALGGTLGFTCRQIDLISQDKRSCKGRVLIDLWEDIMKREATLRKLIFALKEAKMGECLNIIKQDCRLDEIELQETYQEYEKLKANKLVHRQFRKIPNDKFYEALFPTIRLDTMMCPSNKENDLRQRALTCGQFEDCTLDSNSVFISFCPESSFSKFSKFHNQFRKFAEFLQNQGYTLHFEPNCQDAIRRHGGVVTWKEVCIKRSKNIIVICTPEYYKEDSKALEGSKQSSRSKIEVDSTYLRQIVFNRSSQKIIPVVLDAKKPASNQIPMWLQPLVRHTWPSGERDLVLCLQDQPRFILPKVDPSRRKVIKPIVISYPD